MSNIRITKKFSFETGHALYGYDGKCKNVHGHSYKLSVVFEVDRFNILREFSDGISTNTLEVSVNPLYNENETSKFNIYLIDNSGVTVKTIEFATNDSTITLEILFTEKDKEINYAN